MKTNSYLKTLITFFSLTILLASCEKAEPTPAERIEGTWTIESFSGPFFGEGQNIDLISFAASIYPCIKENRIAFDGGNYTASLPATCVDEDGESLFLFPETPTGTYTITDTGEFTLIDGGFPYTGTYTFETNDKFVLTIEEEGDILTIVFARK